MLKYNKIVLLLFVGCLFYSCEKNFEEINTNPNGTQNATPDLLLPTILVDIFNYHVDISFDEGNPSVEMVTKEFSTGIGRYEWTTSNSWGDCYSALRNVYALLDAAEESGNAYYTGIGLILKSYLFSHLTQIYGDIPYSEAVGAKQDVLAPRYDEQENVFTGIFSDLEEANELLNPENNSQNDFVIRGDIVYDNDPEKWRKFANSLHLRLLLRLSEKWDIAGMVSNIADNPSEYPVMQDNSDNFQMKYSQNEPYKYPVFNWREGSWLDNRLAKGLADTLIHFNDNRISAYAEPTASSVEQGDPEYVGVPSGMYDVDVNNYNGGTQNQSYLNTRYRETPDFTHPAMQYSELQLILAECALNNWISGDAEEYYVHGIESSFAYHGVEPEEGYFDQSQV
ncbi:MAG: SusD/RagB family nutrient-binding outer membrane lipoprotein, partial [Bacteroidales bacterium]